MPSAASTLLFEGIHFLFWKKNPQEIYYFAVHDITDYVYIVITLTTYAVTVKTPFVWGIFDQRRLRPANTSTG